jgi:sigma-54 specific flagellar transcriptional regulator A
VFHILDKVAASDSTVLIFVESGTGKELIAEAIHRNSARSRGPFVKLNCAALVESLLLSELFGHERGSFTGAHQRKVGRFEMAAGGTIFLDEIGDISPKTQVALLRVLQEREFERVGGGRPIKLQARVLFATNRNLPQMVREGAFREDLYYRLKGITIELPPLRERPEDIGILAQHFLARYAAESATVERLVSKDAANMLSRYSWPGNIRELENIVRSVALFADGPEIERRDFDEYRELFEDSPAFARAMVSEPRPVASAPRPSTPPVSVSAPPPAWTPPPPTDFEPDGPDTDDELIVPASSGETHIGATEAALLTQIFQLGIPLGELKRRIQDEAIAQALRKTRGNITRAAEMLGMKRPRLSQIINASDALKELCQGVGR